MSSPEPLEIERVYLLRRLPDLPAGAIALRIEQGYLPDDPEPTHAGEITEGRVRRTVRPDGTVSCKHTVKRGEGLVRTEVEVGIDEATFQREWEKTVRRRIRKTRYEVTEGALTWEIDAFDELDLFMAEVELPGEGTEVVLPEWLAPLVLRELTEEPRYRNYALAIEGLPPDHPKSEPRP